MPIWPLWVVEAADSKVGNIAPAPMLSGPKGYLPPLNVTGCHQGPCSRYWRYWQGEQKLCVMFVKPKGENHKAGPQPSAVKPFQRSTEWHDFWKASSGVLLGLGRPNDHSPGSVPHDQGRPTKSSCQAGLAIVQHEMKQVVQHWVQAALLGKAEDMYCSPDKHCSPDMYCSQTCTAVQLPVHLCLLFCCHVAYTHSQTGDPTGGRKSSCLLTEHVLARWVQAASAWPPCCQLHASWPC